MNKAFLLGRLGQDPEPRKIGDRDFAALSVATTRKFKGRDGEPREDTQWHKVEVWQSNARFISNHGMKGTLVFVEGRIDYQTYEKDGYQKYVTKIIAQEIKILDKWKPKEQEPYNELTNEGQPDEI